MSSDDPTEVAGQTAQLRLRTCVNDVKVARADFLTDGVGQKTFVGTWLLQIAPPVIEISGGKDDGDTVFDFVDVDLLPCRSVLRKWSHSATTLTRRTSSFDAHGQKGKTRSRGRDLFEPFEEDEPQTLFDVNRGAGGRREPRRVTKLRLGFFRSFLDTQRWRGPR